MTHQWNDKEDLRNKAQLNRDCSASEQTFARPCGLTSVKLLKAACAVKRVCLVSIKTKTITSSPVTSKISNGFTTQIIHIF